MHTQQQFTYENADIEAHPYSVHERGPARTITASWKLDATRVLELFAFHSRSSRSYASTVQVHTVEGGSRTSYPLDAVRLPSSPAGRYSKKALLDYFDSTMRADSLQDAFQEAIRRDEARGAA